jgi:hypothetical protein
MNKTQIFQNTIRKLSSQDQRHKRTTTIAPKTSVSPWKKNPKFVQYIQNIDKKHKH